MNLHVLRKIDQQLPTLCRQLGIPKECAVRAELQEILSFGEKTFLVFMGEEEQTRILSFNHEGNFLRAEKDIPLGKNGYTKRITVLENKQRITP